MPVEPEAEKPKFGSPSEAAFEELRQRVEEDSDLEEPFKTAFLADLKSAEPSRLASLNAALIEKEGQDAAK